VLPGWSWLAIWTPAARSSSTGAPGAARPGCGVAFRLGLLPRIRAPSPA